MDRPLSAAELADMLKGVSAFLHCHGAPDILFNATEAAIREIGSRSATPAEGLAAEFEALAEKAWDCPDTSRAFHLHTLGFWAMQHRTDILRWAKSAQEARNAAPEKDVVRLVIAARNVAFGDMPPDAADIKELDTASEAFADRVPWEGEPK